MAIISALTIIRSLSLFHLTLAFFFLTAPRTIAEQNLVFILGASMRLPHITSLNKPSPATAFLAVVFAFLGISDFTAASMPEEFALHYWSSQAPVRLLFLFCVTAYTYMFKPGGMAAAKGSRYKAGMGEELKNDLIFTWGFLELTMWFWVYTTVREERRQAAIRLMEKRKAEENRL